MPGNLLQHAESSDYTMRPDITETAGQDAVPTESYGNFGLTPWYSAAGLGGWLGVAILL
jgi:hypothetical protein